LCLSRAVDRGELKPGTNVKQLAFELDAYATRANSYALLHDEPEAFDLARVAMEHALDQAILPRSAVDPGQHEVGEAVGEQDDRDGRQQDAGDPVQEHRALK
ncbi:MAG: hypothetical protein ABIS86_11525, partial [Streptosporangiaceae bacterium]